MISLLNGKIQEGITSCEGYKALIRQPLSTAAQAKFKIQARYNQTTMEYTLKYNHSNQFMNVNTDELVEIGEFIEKVSNWGIL